MSHCRYRKSCPPVASHCKPWRDSSNEERLNAENGLLLTPSVDHLVARGSISFDNDGKLIISPVPHRPSPQRMDVDTTHAVNVGGFTSGQRSSWIFTGTPCCFNPCAARCHLQPARHALPAKRDERFPWPPCTLHSKGPPSVDGTIHLPPLCAEGDVGGSP
jgi:hypothetical protein